MRSGLGPQQKKPVEFSAQHHRHEERMRRINRIVVGLERLLPTPQALVDEAVDPSRRDTEQRISNNEPAYPHVIGSAIVATASGMPRVARARSTARRFTALQPSLASLIALHKVFEISAKLLFVEGGVGEPARSACALARTNRSAERFPHQSVMRTGRDLLLREGSPTRTFTGEQ